MLTPDDKVKNYFDEAARIYSETGDTTMVEELGLHPILPRRTWHYAGRVFHVVRESENEAYLGLRCPTHFHKVYNFSPLDEADGGEEEGVFMWRMGEREIRHTELNPSSMPSKPGRVFWFGSAPWVSRSNWTDSLELSLK